MWKCLQHLQDLRAEARRPPVVLPGDVLRREDALSKAKALAARMPSIPKTRLPPAENFSEMPGDGTDKTDKTSMIGFCQFRQFGLGAFAYFLLRSKGMRANVP